MFHDIRIPSDPAEEGIILRRDGNLVMTNVPHLVVWHSPDGFEWGYGGSGPADLALNITEFALRKLGWEGPTAACPQGHAFMGTVRVYQDFKTAFVATAPREGTTIPWADIVAWLRARPELTNGGPLGNMPQEAP